MKAISLKNCLGLYDVDRSCHLSGDEPRKVYEEVYGRAPTQGELDNLVQNTTLPSGRAWIDAPFAEAKSYLSDNDLGLITKRQTDLQNKAIQPAVDTLQSSIPEIQNRYSTARNYQTAQKEPLKQRYENLLAELKGRESGQISSTQLSTAREYAKRGIPLSSGAYDQALSAATSPISNFYTTQYKDVGINQEQDLMDIDKLLADLTNDETSSIRDVRNLIGQYQAGAGQDAVTQAMSLLSEQKRLNEGQIDRRISQDQFTKNFELNRQQIGQSASEFDRTFGENQRQFNENQALEQARFNRTGSSGGGVSATQSARTQALSDIFGGYRFGSLVNKYGATVDSDWLEQMYNQGPVARQYGPATYPGQQTSTTKPSRASLGS